MIPPVQKKVQFSSPLVVDDEDEDFPQSYEPNTKTHEVLYFLTTADKLGLPYSDLTGKFPVQSSRGNNYILIVYHQDANAILAEALKNRQAQTIVTAWSNLKTHFKFSGNQPSIWVIDNQFSIDLKTALNKEKIKWQLVPPHNHRANAAERAIQTFK